MWVLAVGARDQGAWLQGCFEEGGAKSAMAGRPTSNRQCSRRRWRTAAPLSWLRALGCAANGGIACLCDGLIGVSGSSMLRLGADKHLETGGKRGALCSPVISSWGEPESGGFACGAVR